MAALNSGCLLSIKCSTPNLNSFKSSLNPISLKLPNQISHRSCSKSPVDPTKLSTFPARSVATTTLLWSLLGADFPAMAAKKIAESPENDIRGAAVLIPIVSAIGWVLYNILGPALNQIQRMRSEKGDN